MRVRVRRAVPQDAGWIVSELKAFSRFFGTRRSLFKDEPSARSVILAMIAEHVFLIAENEESSPLGFISGYLVPHSFNPELKVLAETFWWVPEEHRGSRAGLMLLNEFKAIGESVAHWVIFTLEHNSPVREETLTRRGFRLHERQYLLEVS